MISAQAQAVHRFSAAFSLLLALSVGAESSGDPAIVSVARILARPEAYDGKVVRIVGFLNIEFEGDAIYASEEAYRHRLIPDAIWVDVPKDLADRREAYQRRYVILEGTFDANAHGHMGMFPGSLRKISSHQPMWDLGGSCPSFKLSSVAPDDSEYAATHSLASSFLSVRRTRNEGEIPHFFAAPVQERIQQDLQRPQSRLRWILFDWNQSLATRVSPSMEVSVLRIDDSGEHRPPYRIACFCSGRCGASLPTCLNDVVDDPLGPDHFCLGLEKTGDAWAVSYGDFAERSW